MNLTLMNVPTNAATDALLAIEVFAERMYSGRSCDPEAQERYNALASIVLPLRAARDAVVGSAQTLDVADALEGRDAWERYAHRLEDANRALTADNDALAGRVAAIRAICDEWARRSSGANDDAYRLRSAIRAALATT